MLNNMTQNEFNLVADILEKISDKVKEGYPDPNQEHKICYGEGIRECIDIIKEVVNDRVSHATREN